MAEEPKKAEPSTEDATPPAKPSPAAKPAPKAAADDASSTSGGPDVAAIRSKLAQVVWIVCVVFALCLAVGALCIALEANEDNGLVSFVLGMADRVDLGVFSQEGGIKEFGGENADVKNALFNWGLGAIFWLVVGRILERVIRP